MARRFLYPHVAYIRLNEQDRVIYIQAHWCSSLSHALLSMCIWMLLAWASARLSLSSTIHVAPHLSSILFTTVSRRNFSTAWVGLRDIIIMYKYFFSFIGCWCELRENQWTKYDESVGKKWGWKMGKLLWPFPFGLQSLQLPKTREMLFEFSIGALCFTNCFRMLGYASPPRILFFYFLPLLDFRSRFSSYCLASW